MSTRALIVIRDVETQVFDDPMLITHPNQTTPTTSNTITPTDSNTTTSINSDTIIQPISQTQTPTISQTQTPAISQIRTPTNITHKQTIYVPIPVRPMSGKYRDLLQRHSDQHQPTLKRSRDATQPSDANQSSNTTQPSDANQSSNTNQPSNTTQPSDANQSSDTSMTNIEPVRLIPTGAHTSTYTLDGVNHSIRIEPKSTHKTFGKYRDAGARLLQLTISPKTDHLYRMVCYAFLDELHQIVTAAQFKKDRSAQIAQELDRFKQMTQAIERDQSPNDVPLTMTNLGIPYTLSDEYFATYYIRDTCNWFAILHYLFANFSKNPEIELGRVVQNISPNITDAYSIFTDRNIVENLINTFIEMETRIFQAMYKFTQKYRITDIMDHFRFKELGQLNYSLVYPGSYLDAYRIADNDNDEINANHSLITAIAYDHLGFHTAALRWYVDAYRRGRHDIIRHILYLAQKLYQKRGSLLVYFRCGIHAITHRHITLDYYLNNEHIHGDTREKIYKSITVLLCKYLIPEDMNTLEL